MLAPTDGTLDGVLDPATHSKTLALLTMVAEQHLSPDVAQSVSLVHGSTYYTWVPAEAVATRRDKTLAIFIFVFFVIEKFYF